jgi:uncharacterized FAD-dependent dehydrogenase
MQQQILLKLLPKAAESTTLIMEQAAAASGIPVSSITGFRIIKRSVDARSKQIHVLLSILIFIDEPAHEDPVSIVEFPDIPNTAKQVIVVGAGPAGLFAALRLLRNGVRPILLERGKDVRARRRDLAILNKEGIVNPESNYCFGEGGAGTYSDGKLYTRSTKRGNLPGILNLLVQFGAPPRILVDAHPHIGTNKLPQIITSIRKQLMDAGAIFLFEKKIVDLIIERDEVKGVKTADGDIFKAEAVILATGHSARDIFELLHSRKILIEAKPFALGVRIEHPQQLIDSIQYHCEVRDPYLPPAAYSLVQQINNRGVFSFCMCPGGIIAPASTAPGELVVNGWSPSKRDNPFANSGMVVAIEEKDFSTHKNSGPLAAMHFQKAVEQKAFQYGGGDMVAPAQRMADFTQNRISASLPQCSYLPGIRSVALNEVLPPFVHQALQKAFIEFGKKMKGYFTNEAVVVATESRTSSPVRIPRDAQTLQHPQLKNFYPCGEGAGYAGGIVSAAMDGERVADMVLQRIAIA